MSSGVKIVGIYLVKNEELFLDRVISNTQAFCDRIIIADNQSIDGTARIARNWQRQLDKVDVYEVGHPAEAHELIREYCDSRTWIFAVDGDEIYDPAGLVKFRDDLRSGRYDDYWSIYGNVLNCTSIDEEKKLVKGYLAPPCRSMTKLFNFNAITDWGGCTSERLHGGLIDFKAGWDESSRLQLYKTTEWNEAVFRCLHLCFIRRSHVDRVDKNGISMRQNLVELQVKGVRKWLRDKASLIVHGTRPSDYKRQKYMRGELVEKDCSSFL